MKATAGFTVIELNKGDKILFRSGQVEPIDKHGYVMFAEDWEKWLDEEEKAWKEDRENYK